jgi:hypothetical protein
MAHLNNSARYVVSFHNFYAELVAIFFKFFVERPDWCFT